MNICTYNTYKTKDNHSNWNQCSRSFSSYLHFNSYSLQSSTTHRWEIVEGGVGENGKNPFGELSLRVQKGWHKICGEVWRAQSKFITAFDKLNYPRWLFTSAQKTNCETDWNESRRCQHGFISKYQLINPSNIPILGCEYCGRCDTAYPKTYPSSPFPFSIRHISSSFFQHTMIKKG